MLPSICGIYDEALQNKVFAGVDFSAKFVAEEKNYPLPCAGDFFPGTKNKRVSD